MFNVKILVVVVLQRLHLWKENRSCLCLGESCFQLALRWTCHWVSQCLCNKIFNIFFKYLRKYLRNISIAYRERNEDIWEKQLCRHQSRWKTKQTKDELGLKYFINRQTILMDKLFQICLDMKDFLSENRNIHVSPLLSETCVF